LMCSFTELMSNHKNPMVASELKLGEDDELSKKSIKFLIDLVHQNKISPLEVIKFKEMQSYQYFFEKDAFAVRGWPGFLSEDNKFFPKEFRGKVKAAPLPHLDGSSPAYVFGGWNLMVSKLSSKIQEVRIFIEYMLSDEIQKFHYEDGNVLPVKKSVYSDATFLKKHPELVFYQKLFENGIHRPMFERYTGLSDIIVKHINEAIEKNIEPGQVLQKIKNEIGAK
jgi:multiple sugar transport system substrate-binding protein